MTNPSFDKKASTIIVSEEGKAERETLSYEKLARKHLDDFVKCYNTKNILKRKETEKFHAYSYNDLIKRNKMSRDIFWFKDDSLEDIENLPAPEIVADEVKENLEYVLDSINELIITLEEKNT